MMTGCHSLNILKASCEKADEHLQLSRQYEAVYEIDEE